MKRCVLAGPYPDAEALYADLAHQLGFPRHFGSNLDALWDALTKDLPGPAEIIWKDFAKARKALGPVADRIRKTLDEVAAERRDVTVVIRGSND
jgi:ribonuclease inhibitor